MRKLYRYIALGLLGALATPFSASAQPNNLIIFVADGLRPDSVGPETAPALSMLRAKGVDFRNSHALFPTVTMANASAIATGHYLGDTGVFGNSVYTRFPVVSATRTVTPSIQSNSILAEINDRAGGNFLGEQSLLAAARAKGYATAAIGKSGAIGIQDVTQLKAPQTIFVDDDLGAPTGIPISPAIQRRANEIKAKLTHSDAPALPDASHQEQRHPYRDIATEIVLPALKESGKPFVLIYWSPDPDRTQHVQTDSIGNLTPGINGPSSLAAVRRVDDDLAAIIRTIKDMNLEERTNVFVTSDHGFSTVTKQSSTSPSSRLSFSDVPSGHLPPGFLAIDLAEYLGLPLHEPSGPRSPVNYKEGTHPRQASALLGTNPDEPEIVIAANAGANLIYLPRPDAEKLAPRVVQALLTQDYVSGIFLDGRLGRLPGTLPLETIGLEGRTTATTPSIVVSFRSYSTRCARPLGCGVIVADTTLRQGQGDHGSFSRADTANFMAAMGPAFRKRLVSRTPASNADVAPTLANILGVQLQGLGKAKGRVLTEALEGGKQNRFFRRDIVSAPSDSGLRTIVNLQYVGNTRYFSAAGFPGRTLGLRVPRALD